MLSRRFAVRISGCGAADALVVVGSPVQSLPHTDARPPWPLSRPMRTFWGVDLPAPLGPRTPKISPRPTVKSMPRTAGSVAFRIRVRERVDANDLGHQALNRGGD
jgi:hypothetical protein